MYSAFSRRLLVGATTGSGVLTAADTHGLKDHTFYVTGTGTINAGVVTIESAPSAEYSGTWANVAKDYEDAPITITPVSGTVVAVSIKGAFLALRARISTAIGGGGSVTVDYVGA